MNAYQESPYGAYDAYVHQQQQQMQTAVAEAAREVEGLGFSQYRQQHGQHGLASSAGILPPPHPFAGRMSGYSAPNANHMVNGSAYPAQHSYYTLQAQNHDALRNAGFAFIPAPGQYPSATSGQPQFVSATRQIQDFPTSFHGRNSHAQVADEVRRYNESCMLPIPHPSLQPAFEQANNGWTTSQFDLCGRQDVYEPMVNDGYGREIEGQWTRFGEELTYGDTRHHQMDPTRTDNDYVHSTFIEPPAAQQPNLNKASRRDSRAHNMEEAVPAVPVEEVQLIAPDASAIPPPPPIAKSAHPLAALATDLVWEAFLAAANNNSPASLSPAQFASGDRSGRGRFDEGSPISRQGNRSSASPSVISHQRTPSKTISPHVKKHNRSRSASAGIDGETQVPHNFGAIGGERKPRVSLESSPGSDSSSPASSAPGTPAMDTWMISATQENGHGFGRLGGSGYWSDEDNMGAVHANGKHSLPPLSTLLRPFALQQQQRFGGVTPPLALFEQIQKLLAATLLSQQVLLLALYYVSRIPYTSPLYPPATSQSALQSTSAPFKLLLAALVVANKHLDDNSFRNSTFAQVANITVPEVNALEYSLLGDLHFDINVGAPVWMAWLRELQGHQATRFTRDQVSSSLILLEVIRGVQIQSEELDLCREQGRHAISLGPESLLGFSRRTRNNSLTDFMGMPSTPRSESSMSGGFDLDAAGPIEQRPRYSKQFYVPPISGQYGVASTGQYYSELSLPTCGMIGHSSSLKSSGRMVMA